MTSVLAFLDGLPPVLVYVVLGLGAAIENVLPPIPADTFVLAGGFISARGVASPVGVFLVTWLANAASALGVYWIGLRRGHAFFEAGPGSRLLSAHQLRSVSAFYERWGVLALLFTRFLPGLRVVAPVFAGVSGQPVWRVAPPVVLASAVWYGGLVWVGATARQQMAEADQWVNQVNKGFLAVALLAALVLFVWWRRTRAPNPSPGRDA